MAVGAFGSLLFWLSCLRLLTMRCFPSAREQIPGAKTEVAKFTEELVSAVTPIFLTGA